jgi:uncharacterized protein YkwD
MSALTSTFGRVLALAALLTFVSVGPSVAASDYTAETKQTYESQVIAHTNDVRTDRDKVAVKAQACVDRWAEGQARWMAKSGKFQHRDGRLRKILKRCHLTGVSENVAYGYTSGDQAVSAWTHSSGHRKNLLSGKMRYIGVGAVKKNGVWWVAQVFGTRR